MKLFTEVKLNFTVFEKIICGIILLIHINNLFLDIMRIDAAQYASISLEMLQNHSYLQVYDLQSDYLDKPPFLFWISSWSMNALGICNFAYKIGAFPTLIIGSYFQIHYPLLQPKNSQKRRNCVCHLSSFFSNVQ